MAIIKDEIGIKSIEEIFEYNLKIPIYQRPYTWSLKSVKKLYSDILNAYNDNLNAYYANSIEYRLGTIILHKKEVENEKTNTYEYVYNIIDGQQRLITLSLLIYALSNTELKVNLIEQEVNKLSNKAIMENYFYIEEVVSNIEHKDKLLNYILNNCTLGFIVTNQLEEAFQFFESQNSRGKPLKPHDLLKAYHLREMKNHEDSDDIIKECILKWQSVEESELVQLFSDYLFPIRLWCNEDDKRIFTINDIDYFQGVSSKKEYNYILYRLHNNQENNIYQINETIFSGKYFFNYIFYYYELLNKILKLIKERNELIVLNNQDYINNMFYCALILYIDRFNIDFIKKEQKEIRAIYKWSYGLRLSKKIVRNNVINKYATGRYDKEIGCGPLFKIINGMKAPEDILKLDIKINFNKNEDNPKYDKIIEYLSDKDMENNDAK